MTLTQTSGIAYEITSRGGGPTGYFHQWLALLFERGHACGLDLVDEMIETEHPGRSDSNVTAASMLTAARGAGWILFDGQSPRAHEVPRFDSHLSGDRWQADCYAWIHAFTPNRGSGEAVAFLAASKAEIETRRASALVGSPVYYEVFVDGAVHGEPTKDLDVVRRAAHAAFDARAGDKIAVCGTDTRPEARTGFWREGRINMFGQWVES